jgi:hypothetical protein
MNELQTLYQTTIVDTLVSEFIFYQLEREIKSDRFLQEKDNVV